MRFYVYDLIDPRTGTVFYVGKGQGNRCHDHQRQALAGGRSAKCRLIRDILDSGQKPTILIVKRFTQERAAYSFEIARIDEIGLPNLTNIVPGGEREWRKKTDPDTVEARILVGLAVQSNGFEYGRTFRFCCKSHQIPDQFMDVAKGRLEALIARRGVPWILSQMPKKSIGKVAHGRH